jgi:hypothetical protein
MAESDEEEVLKNYGAEKLVTDEKLKEYLVEDSKLALKSL